MKKIRTLKLGKMLLVLIKKECINEESDYSVENTSDNEDFRSTIFQPFQFEHEQKTAGESQEKEKKHIYASAANLLYIRKGNLNCCMGGHCKNEATEIDCLCCREIEVDAMLIILTKIPQCEESISLPAFMSYCLTISRTC